MMQAANFRDRYYFTQRGFLHRSMLGCVFPSDSRSRLVGDSGEAERLFRKEAERHSGMIPNTIGA